MPAGLALCAVNLASNEELVLRSLVRLLDGHYDLRLRYSESAADCNVVFVPADAPTRLPARCVPIRVVAPGSATPSPAYGLTVPAPLRMTNVIEVLRRATQLLSATPEAGLLGLFRRLTQLAQAHERRLTWLSLRDGRPMIVDFGNERLWTSLSTEELLEGSYCVGEAERATPSQVEAMNGLPGHRLRELLWAASHRLGDSGVAGPELTGTFRLRRWPDAAALSRRGYPQLCAFLTSRSMTPQQASDASGLPLPVVCWFIETSLALGIATVSEPSPPRAAAAKPSPDTRSVFGRLRERLKLW